MAGLGDPVLPPEICREIVARLPAKSVLRCRSVCKPWYSLISCPNFISHYSTTNLDNNNGNRLLLQLEDVESGVPSFSSHDESCMESPEHDHDCPEQVLGEEPVIIGSCNGLICLSEYDSLPGFESVSTVAFVIWNPAIRRVVRVPSLCYCSSSQHVSLVGFGFDSNTGDYKVMCSFRKKDGRNSDCKVFDLREGGWRTISPLVPPQIVRCPLAECYVHGAVHWSASRNGRGLGRVILSFNMSDESFREIRMPDCAEFTRSVDDEHMETRCMALGGLVHLIVWKVKLDEYFVVVDESEICSVWAMKEYGVTESWIKVSNIDLRSAKVLPSARLRPGFFILWAKREVLMVYNLLGDDDEDFLSKQDLVLYNTGNRKSKHIFSFTKCIQGLCRYKESLVLM